MKWISVSILISACIFFAMAGLTAGINLNPSSTVSYVWDWSAAGSWASGIGALLAVVFALCQSYKQQRKERARCRILLEEGEWYLKVQIVSEGIIPANILSASISFSGGTHVYHLSKFSRLGVIFPKKLERGDVLTLIDVSRDDYRRLALALTDLVVVDMQKRDVTPTIYDKERAELYFDELKSYESLDAHLLLKTAHVDMLHALPQSFMRTCFSLVQAEQRMKWEEGRKSLRADFGILEPLFNTPDGDSAAQE